MFFFNGNRNGRGENLFDSHKPDYREAVIEFSTYKDLPLSSTTNNVHSIIKLVKITCPYCKKEMQQGRSTGGVNRCYTFLFKCECGKEAKLTVDPEEFLFFK